MYWFIFSLFLAFIVVASALIAYMTAERGREKFTKLDWGTAVFSLVSMIVLLFAHVDSMRKDAVKDYDEGKIVKVVTYKTETINGEAVKADSTYTFRRVR